VTKLPDLTVLKPLMGIDLKNVCCILYAFFHKMKDDPYPGLLPDFYSFLFFFKFCNRAYDAD